MPRKGRKRIRIGPRRVRNPTVQWLEKNTPPKLIFNNPRSSIKPGSAPDPYFLVKQVKHTLLGLPVKEVVI